MTAFDAISQARWASLAAGKAGAPTAEEWPAVAVALVLLAVLGGTVIRLTGLSWGETMLLAILAPLLVLVDLPLGEGGRGVRVAVNAAGCLVPVAIGLSVVVTRRSAWPAVVALLAAGVTLAYFSSRVVPARGVLLEYQQCALGIGVLSGLFFWNAPRLAGAWGFASAAVGTLVGADLLRLSELLVMPNAAVITLGGAGLLDGILLTSVLAALVATCTARGLRLLLGSREHAASPTPAPAAAPDGGLR